SGVALEAFTVPGLWLPASAEAECLGPEPFSIRTVAAPYSPSTPDGRPIEAKLVDAGAGRPEDFERLGDSARGAIGLVKRGEMKSFEDLFAEYMETLPMLTAAAKAHVAGLLLQSTRPRGLLYRHPVSLNGSLV